VSSKLNKRIYVCATPFHVLCALTDMFTNSYTGTLIIENNISALNSYLRSIVSRLTQISEVDKVVYVYRSRFAEVTLIQSLIDHINKQKYESLLKGADGIVIYPWCPETVYKKACYIYKMANKNVILVEDGAESYKRPLDSKIKRWIKKNIYQVVYEFQKDKKISSIFVSKPSVYLPLFGKNIKRFNIKQQLEDIDIKHKKIILSIFLNKTVQKQISAIDNSKHNVLILTQPLYLFNGVEKSRQVQMYGFRSRIWTHFMYNLSD